ncbi:hypothetical protein [Henriciella aquimarina]|uniref:hypothetical protein n=1 Tax=Henriciella aquimarina TaxID=545261 RepID=UPI001301DEC2|nr:hypothetical protein [Henriciella aquimarina]
MTGTYFETFLVGGLGLLVAAVLAIAWLLWRQDDTRREAIKLSLEGIGHEFRFNMFQTVHEIADLEAGEIKRAGDLPELAHPQLNAVLAQTMATDKRALAAVQATYQSVEAAKRRVRLALSEDRDIGEALEGLKAATIDGISTLYLWEDHEGRAPQHARSTRSWWVRDWMKAHGFEQNLMPGVALRDAVVENLRSNGMILTPKPLTLSAHEYYARQYDRQADPRGVFGKRRIRKETPAAAAVAMTEADAGDNAEEATPEPVAAPETVPVETAEAAEETQKEEAAASTDTAWPATQTSATPDEMSEPAESDEASTRTDEGETEKTLEPAGEAPDPQAQRGGGT